MKSMIVLLILSTACISKSREENSLKINNVKEIERETKGAVDTLYKSNLYELVKVEDSENVYLLHIYKNSVDTLITSNIGHCENVFGLLKVANEDYFIWENGSCGSGNKNNFSVYNREGNLQYESSGLIYYAEKSNKVVFGKSGNRGQIDFLDLKTNKIIHSFNLNQKKYPDYYSLNGIENNKDEIIIRYDDEVIYSFKK